MNHTRAAILAASMIVAAAPAMADDYSDLLEILRAKGSLTQGEYSSLLAKHQHNMRATGRHRGREAPVASGPTPEEADAAAEARRSALAAAASAAAADEALRKGQTMMTEMTTAPDIVHVEPYKPGGGVTIRVGSVDLNFSGIVNGYYTYSSAGSGQPGTQVAGGLVDDSGFDSSAIRNGLLPGAFIVSASTTQAGIDVSAVFGVFPGINSANVTGPLNANSGGSPVALGTAGVDFRKTYLTFGTKELGTIKVGRDIGIFGSDAILDDFTLLSVGATGGNSAPANTSLGRIGIGYIYADFMPQISYTSPIFAGFQGTIGVFQPEDAFNSTGYSASSTTHSVPEFEGKVTYDYVMGAATKARIWAGFMTQRQENIVTDLGPTNTGKTAAAGEVGAKVDVGPFGVTGYYYRGTGIGTTGKFFDGIALNGSQRDSEGFYIQGSWKPIPKLKLVGSYGESSLYQAPGEDDPLLVRRNEAEIGAGYYSLTDWVTLVGEYAHEQAKSHGPNSVSADAVTAGAILFY